MSKERFFKGTFLLTSAGLISRIMGFFYRIFLSHTIGAEGIGLYQLVVPLQHLVLAMTTFGIQTALSRLISSHTALGEKKEAQDCFRIGTFLALFLSGIAAWSIFTFSDFFAVQILKEGETMDWNLFGSLCTVNDILVKQMPVRNLTVGDVIVFENTGAYSTTEGIALFLSRDLPKILLRKEDGEIHVLRDSIDTDPLNTPNYHE